MAHTIECVCKKLSLIQSLTYVIPVIILGPPEAPTTSLTRPFSSTKIEGDIDEVGLFPGLMKLFFEAGIS